MKYVWPPTAHNCRPCTFTKYSVRMLVRVLKEKVMGKRKFFSRTRSGVPLFLPILSHIRALARGKDKKNEQPHVDPLRHLML